MGVREALLSVLFAGVAGYVPWWASGVEPPRPPRRCGEERHSQGLDQHQGTPDADAKAAAYRARAAKLGWQVGEVPSPNEEVELTFALKLQSKHSLEDMLMSVSDPMSPDYGKHLSKKEVDDLTKPSTTSLATVREALAPFPVREVGGGSSMKATLPIASAERLLGGQFVRFCRQHGPMRSCILRNPTAEVPTVLREVSDVILPLDEPLPPPLMQPLRVVRQPQSLLV